MGMDAILRMPSSRTLGPAHVLTESMNALETSHPGLLDLPLVHTEAYKPKESGSGGGELAENISCGSSYKLRGLKRKGISEDTAPALAKLAHSVPSTVETMRKEPTTDSAAGQEGGVVNAAESYQEISSNAIAVDMAEPSIPLAAINSTNSASEVPPHR